MITEERRVELLEMNDVHAVDKNGMFRIKTPEFIELLDDLDEVESAHSVQTMQYAALSGQVRKKGAEIVRLRKALLEVLGWVRTLSTKPSVLLDNIESLVSDTLGENKS